MRICLISREYPPETGYGGIATFTRHLAHGLALLGHDVVVVSLAKEKPRSYTEEVVPGVSHDTAQKDTAEKRLVTIHRVLPYEFPSKLNCVNMAMPYSRYLLCTSTALWYKFTELHREKPFDVVDTPELLAEGIYPAVTRALPMVIRLYTPHSKFISEKLHNVSASFDHQFVAMIERVAMLSADVLTSPSDDLAEFVAGDLGIKQEDICIVRNPIDTTIFTPKGETMLPPAAASGKLRVLFVGRLEERKGINYLIQALPTVVKACPNVEFVIIGDDTNTAEGQTSVLAKLKEALKAAGATGAVTFIDRVPLDSLPAYYRSADISIVPSVYDNSPYTCLEAMACGRAVIGTSAGGTKEYMVHNESGLIIPAKDPQAIAEALIKLLTDQAERERLASGARARAVEKFDRKEIARQTAELYELAMANFKGNGSGSIKHLYQHSYLRATEDATIFLDAMDKMIYDLLYQQSYRFRVSHWFHFLKARPKLFVAKALSKTSRILLKLCGTKEERYPNFLRKLESDIKLKELAARSGQPSALKSNDEVSVSAAKGEPLN